MHATLKSRPRARRHAGVTDALERVARAVDALRGGRGVSISGDARVSALAVETAGAEEIARFRSAGALLILTHARGRTLKIRLYTPGIVAIPLDPDWDIETLRAIADPTADMETPLKGPFPALRGPLPASYASAVKLAKLAGLLPACIVRPGGAGSATVATTDIDNYESEAARTLKIVSRALVPLEGAEQTEIVAFRAGDGGLEHYAIVIGSPPTSKPVLTRLHSECFTGDLLGSLKCDCGEQLRGAIAAISKAGAGVLLYLAQEGRGIGLVNKLRAYRLQDQGFDTLQANERLGFEADERLYGVAARMLELLGFGAVRLMTNNPAKVAALKAAGVKVARRVPHHFPSNPHNRAYLAAKATKAGHLF
jgi:GTP cyclohydrolase II